MVSRFKRLVLSGCIALSTGVGAARGLVTTSVKSIFTNPPASARPWVYWYFMDGNLTREGTAADLASMKAAGIGGAIFLTVNVGIKVGPVPFMSPTWQSLTRQAFDEAQKLGISIAFGAGLGWCGTGGPWITPEQSMQHLVGTQTDVEGPVSLDEVLEKPKPRKPFFGVATLTPSLKAQWTNFYCDESVIAFPTPAAGFKIHDLDERALYYRGAFSSGKHVRPFLPPLPANDTTAVDASIDPKRVIDLTSLMDATGRLKWKVPAGHWTIVRLGRTLTGQTTRPAPTAGLGFETDKFSKAALDAHFASYIDPVLGGLRPASQASGGVTMLHFDSWEMSSQNASPHFRDEFKTRRGYDPLPYWPAILGRIVGSVDITDRFLWDLRQTAQELVVENQAMHLRDLAHDRGYTLSLEPYDLDPCADLKLGMAADLPMGEFWSTGHGFHTEYSIIEATSVGHTMNRPVIGAESFTAGSDEHWLQYPGSMKAQTDWALCAGINKFVIHRYQNQPTVDERPGMTMGPYGVHWERTQTWWGMVPAYHKYLARCSAMLREGLPVADVLYLTPEGAPMVFQPPASALTGPLQDRRGYNFDGCCPDALIERAVVHDGNIVMSGGVSYRLLVMPEIDSMTPALLAKISQLLHDGATIIGSAPQRAPGLNGDERVRQLAHEIWGDAPATRGSIDTAWLHRSVGKGTLIVDPNTAAFPNLYPSYDVTAAILSSEGLPPDFEASAPLRYVHRKLSDGGANDLYFIANTDTKPIDVVCKFRATGDAQWWDAVTGQTRALTDAKREGQITVIPLRLDPLGSGFVVVAPSAEPRPAEQNNFAQPATLSVIAGPWTVHFDPRWGGPDQATFNDLTDWTKRTEPGIRGYSGLATYSATFTVDAATLASNKPRMLSLGDVKNIASVKLNGHDLGVAWCVPWQVAIPTGVLQANNQLQITVANLWINRLITDSGLPVAQQLTKTTWNPFKPSSPLQPSGLLGPVTLQTQP